MTHKQLTKIALYAVWTGAAIGLFAALSHYYRYGMVEQTTLIFSVIALLLSIPTYRQSRRKETIKAAKLRR